MSVLSGRKLAMYVGLCAVWGSTWLAIKIGLRDLPPLLFAGVRMALACLLLTPFAFAGGGKRPSPEERGWIAWGGFLQIGVSYACIFLAEQRIDTGLAALLFATFPIFVGVFAHFLLPDEPLTRRTVLSALVGLSGVAVIEGPVLASSFATTETRSLLIGGSLILLSALVAAYSNVINKKHLGAVSAFRNVWGQTLVGSSVLLFGAAALERGAPARWTASAVWSSVYLAVIGTALPFVGPFLADPARARLRGRDDPGRRHGHRDRARQPRAPRSAFAPGSGRRRAHPGGRPGGGGARTRRSRGIGLRRLQSAPSAAPRTLPLGRS